jgi:hypothetical protein
MPDSRLKVLLARFRNLLLKRKGSRPKDPEPQDPYAYVTAPKKPRPPYLSGGAWLNCRKSEPLASRASGNAQR